VPQENFDQELGRILANHRRELGISQEFLSSSLRRDQTHVSKVETGKRSMTVEEFLRWSKALNLDNGTVIETLSKLKSHVE
jgi:transcriptional regulator with XRE-family HTH domain